MVGRSATEVCQRVIETVQPGSPLAHVEGLGQVHCGKHYATP